MKIAACVALLFSLAALSSADEPFRAAEADWGKVVDGVTMDQGVLGFGSLRLGMTRAQAEKALGRALAVFKIEEVPVCGEWGTEVFVQNGADISLQFPGNTEESPLQSIRIDSPRGEILTIRSAVIKRTKKRIPGLVFVPSMHEPELYESDVWAPVYSPRENPKQAVVLILPYGRILVTMTACLE